MNPQLIADLEAARALIDTPEKWGKGNGPISPRGCECVLGAVAMSIPFHAADRRFFVKEALRETGLIPRSLAINAWNDAPERTHAEVLELFDKAIANERSKA